MERDELLNELRLNISATAALLNAIERSYTWEYVKEKKRSVLNNNAPIIEKYVRGLIRDKQLFLRKTPGQGRKYAAKFIKLELSHVRNNPLLVFTVKTRSRVYRCLPVRLYCDDVDLDTFLQLNEVDMLESLL